MLQLTDDELLDNRELVAEDELRLDDEDREDDELTDEEELTLEADENPLDGVLEPGPGVLDPVLLGSGKQATYLMEAGPGDPRLLAAD